MRAAFSILGFARSDRAHFSSSLCLMSGFPFTYPRSRRDFLQLLTLAGLSSFTRGPSLTVPAKAAPPLFEEIAPAASGIAWKHDNAMSPNRYLPETMGPGVAFFDFDNDGWLDIFMVNSGA